MKIILLNSVLRTKVKTIVGLSSGLDFLHTGLVCYHNQFVSLKKSAQSSLVYSTVALRLFLHLKPNLYIHHVRNL